MSLFFRQLVHKLALMMIAVVTLQFAGANLGAHQLHLGSHEEESETHPHLQFTAEVVSLQQCVDCQCGFDEPELETPHQHQISKTETQTFDLCLDCQCHGGHVTLVSQLAWMPSVPVSDEPASARLHYLPPVPQAAYRPPISLS